MFEDTDWGMLIVSIVIYAIMIVLIKFALKSESLDIFCPQGTATYSKPTCGDGKGKYYCGARAKEDDKVSDLLNNIEHLSETDSKTVKWRRSFILAVFIAIILSILVLKKFPNGPELLLLIFVPFTVCYFGYTYYQQHYYKFVSDFTKENVDLLRKKLNQTKQTKVVI